jgi:hypothetical protein
MYIIIYEHRILAPLLFFGADISSSKRNVMNAKFAVLSSFLTMYIEALPPPVDRVYSLGPMFLYALPFFYSPKGLYPDFLTCVYLERSKSHIE